MDENIVPSSTAEGCANCGSPAVEKGYPTPLCHECRQQFIKYPIPRLILIFAVIIGVAVIASLISFPAHLSKALHYEKGVQAIEKHRYHTAQKELTQFVKEAPDNLEAKAYLALSAFYNADLSTVFEQAGQVVGKDIDNNELVRNLNSISDRLEEYYPGDSLQMLMHTNPDSTNDITDSLLIPYIAGHPQDVYALMTYASHLYQANQYAACDSIVKRILAKDAFYLPALRINMSIQRELGNYEAAIKSSDDILKVNSEAAYAVAGKARTFLKQHEDKKGLQIARHAVEMDPGDYYATCTLVMALHFNGQVKERDELFRSIKEGNKNELTAYITYVEEVISGKEKFRN